MTILELMERANVRDTNLAIAFIKDAITQIQSTTDISTKVEKQSLIKGINEYSLPSDMVSLLNVSILDTRDDNKYKQIRRLASKPIVREDTDPE